MRALVNDLVASRRDIRTTRALNANDPFEWIERHDVDEAEQVHPAARVSVPMLSDAAGYSLFAKMR
jgi:hypothetical protein